jgi:hypothetical protein
VTVTPAPLPFPTSTAPNAYGDQIIFTTDVDGDIAHVVALNQTAQGASLALQTPANPLDFGNVADGTSGAVDVMVVNSGNLGASVTVAAATTSGLGTFTVNAQPTAAFPALAGSQKITIGFRPGATDLGASNGHVSFTLDPTIPLCSAPPPAQLPVSASGIASLLGVSPVGVISFTGPGFGPMGLASPPLGFTYCGTQSPVRTITLTNNAGPRGPAITIKSALLAGGAASPFKVFGPTNGDPAGTVIDNDGGSCNLTIIPAQIPWGTAFGGDPFSDTLTVVTDAPGDQPHVIVLKQQMYGWYTPDLGPQPLTTHGVTFFDFGTVTRGITAVANMSLTNAGNAPVTITAPTSGLPAGLFIPTVTIPASPVPGQALAVPSAASGIPTYQATFMPPLDTATGPYVWPVQPTTPPVHGGGGIRPVGGPPITTSMVNCAVTGGLGPYANVQVDATVQ